jgi:hypothetical protein
VSSPPGLKSASGLVTERHERDSTAGRAISDTSDVPLFSLTIQVEALDFSQEVGGESLVCDVLGLGLGAPGLGGVTLRIRSTSRAGFVNVARVAQRALEHIHSAAEVTRVRTWAPRRSTLSGYSQSSCAR